MKTMSSCSIMLDKLGFTSQFQVVEKGLESITTGTVYTPHEVKVVNYYRFDGEVNPDDNAIVYAIESNNGERGILIDSYAANLDVRVSTFISQVNAIRSGRKNLIEYESEDYVNFQFSDIIQLKNRP